MGFIEEIERRKQEQIQQELARKAEQERQRQATAQKAAREAAEENERVEINAKGFLQDSRIITGLLDQLHQFGYKDYFENVSAISRFNMQQIFYTAYPNHEFNSVDRRIPTSQLPEIGSELTKQQLQSQEKLEEAFSRLGWPQFVSWSGIKKEATRPPNCTFFGNNVVVAVKEKKLIEPQGVGIGVCFLKKDLKIKEHRSRLTELLRQEYDYLSEMWEHAVYIRIDSHSGATITGSNQHRVSLQDLRLFDELLGQAIHNPAMVYSRYTDRWTPPSPPSSSYPRPDFTPRP